MVGWLVGRDDDYDDGGASFPSFAFLSLASFCWAWRRTANPALSDALPLQRLFFLLALISFDPWLCSSFWGEGVGGGPSVRGRVCSAYLESLGLCFFVHIAQKYGIRW